MRHIIFVLFWSCGASAVLALETPREEFDLTLVTIESHPMTVLPEQGEKYAYGSNEAKPVLRRCGVRANIIVAPSWSRAYNMALTGLVDGLMPANKSAERQQHFYFPQSSFTSMAVVVFTNKDNSETKFTGFDMFNGKKFGKLSGSLLTPAFDAFIQKENIEVLERTTLTGLFEMLVQKEVDYAADQALMDANTLKDLEVDDNVRALKPALETAPLYIAISKKGAFAQDPTNTKFKCMLK